MHTSLKLRGGVYSNNLVHMRPPPPAPPHAHTHTHTITLETVALYDYEKQEDDELSLKEGDVITDVEQVCAVSELCLKTGAHAERSQVNVQENMQLVYLFQVYFGAEIFMVEDRMCTTHSVFYHEDLRFIYIS